MDGRRCFAYLGNENGRVRHARIRIGDSIVMLNGTCDEYQATVADAPLRR